MYFQVDHRQIIEYLAVKRTVISVCEKKKGSFFQCSCFSPSPGERCKKDTVRSLSFSPGDYSFLVPPHLLLILWSPPIFPFILLPPRPKKPDVIVPFHKPKLASYNGSINSLDIDDIAYFKTSCLVQ